MKNAVIDIETLGTKPNKNRQSPVVLSLGCAMIEGGKIIDTFYCAFNLMESQERGFFIDADTLLWWVGQNNELFVKTIKEGLPASNRDSLEAFIKFFERHNEDEDTCIWGNSHSFDCTRLEDYYTAYGLEVPWSYKNERCFRTVKALDGGPWKDFTGGTPHNALDDAKHEAEWLIEIAQRQGKHI